MIFDIILMTAWFFLPAMFANMAPVLFKWIPVLDYPADFKLKCRGKRIFGSHKTLRGVLLAVLVAILVVFIQSFLPTSYNLIDYKDVNIFLLGFLFGFGAMAGDMIESFFKRQFGIKPGRPWFPWDQIDWAVGTGIFVSIVFIPHWSIMLCILILAGVGHPIMNYLGYLLKITKNKW